MSTKVIQKFIFATAMFAAISFVENSVFAQAAPQDPSSPQIDAKTLQQNMKDIGSTFKALATVANDPSQNATSAAQADKILASLQATLNQIPDSISTFPANEQDAALADYKRLIQNEIDLTTKLSASFKANDNATAVSLMTQMNDLKKEGHNKYK